MYSRDINIQIYFNDSILLKSYFKSSKLFLIG